MPVIGKDSGVADGVALSVAEDVAVTVGLGVGVAVGDILGVAVGLGVGEGVFPDGVATKAGTSPACTTKFLVSVLVIPDVSSQETVIE